MAFAGGVFLLTLLLCLILPFRSFSHGTNLAIVGTLIIVCGTLYLFLFGMIRRASRLIEDRRELSNRLLSLMNNIPGIV
jgi:hypothetical protein